MQEERQGEEFIRLYNELDHAVKQVVDVKGSTPFWKRIRMAAKSMPAIKRNMDDLLEFHELRNAIVHHRQYPDVLLAIPTEKTLSWFRQIVGEITSPARVIPAFAREIHVFVPTSPLHEAMAYMKNHGFRQIVARHAGKLTLVTPNGIANWLLAQVNNGRVDLRELRLEEMLEYEEQDSFRVISQNETIDNVRDLFEKANRVTPRRLYAVLVTESGAATESPLGIITPRDLLGNP